MIPATYLEAVQSLNRYDFVSRRVLCHKYAFAIPDDAAIAAIASYSPIIEIGAGSGYWAHLLSNAGADVVAYDNGSWHETFDNWYPVHRGGPEAIRQYPDHTLFLCWPPYMDSMAYDCLQHYTGKRFLAITEGSYGCCGGVDFWEEVNKNWKMIFHINIPHYEGIHDYLGIYERNTM